MILAHWLYLLAGVVGMLVGAYEQETDDAGVHVRGNHELVGQNGASASTPSLSSSSSSLCCRRLSRRPHFPNPRVSSRRSVARRTSSLMVQDARRASILLSQELQTAPATSTMRLAEDFLAEQSEDILQATTQSSRLSVLVGGGEDQEPLVEETAESLMEESTTNGADP